MQHVDLCGLARMSLRHITLRRIAPYLDPTASNLPDVGLSESLHTQILESPAAQMPMKEVYREIARLFNSTFVIFIDLSHLFAGEPCMLRYTVHPDQDFDVQWDEIRALKRNAQGAVVQRWHLHLDRQERWATCLKAASSFWVPLYGNQKAESAEMQNITGVAITTSEAHRGWFWSLVPSISAPSDDNFAWRLASFKSRFAMEPSCRRVT